MKDTKDKEKSEIKDIKDKDKDTVKDTKDKEKSEIKDIKDKDKDKDKDTVKDTKDKEKSEIKEIIDASPSQAQDVGGRLAQLEQTVASLVHFITAADRPDLQHSALGEEADLASQLKKQATDAKAMKDQKDVEKVREY